MSFVRTVGVWRSAQGRLRASRGVFMTSKVAKHKRFDTHVHIWSTPDDERFKPNPKYPLPPLAGDAEFLIKQMDENNVAKACIVQPINYLFDHSYIVSKIEAYPDRFIGMALANTTSGPKLAESELRRLVEQFKFKGVRLNPTLLPPSETLDGPTAKKVVATAAELDIPVAMFVQPNDYKNLDALLDASPPCKVIIDHMGFCGPNDDIADELIALMTKHQNTYVKVSALFRQTKKGYPYKEMLLAISRVKKASKHMSKRMLWGSDFPFVMTHGTYQKAFSFMESIPSMSLNDVNKIANDNAMALFGLDG